MGKKDKTPFKDIKTSSSESASSEPTLTDLLRNLSSKMTSMENKMSDMQ